MNAQYHWIRRRVRRTVWLLRERETRGDMVAYLATQSYSYVRATARRIGQAEIHVAPSVTASLGWTARSSRGR